MIGATLGQYQLIEQIGRGGMATVYRAQQASLGRDVAVKVLRDPLDPMATARFEREARAVASLHHPNILPLYDYGEDGGHRYLVTQYIAGGRTLADEVAAGPLAPARALRLMALVLDALAYAHGRGIVHRDVKPANLMLPAPDWPLLADFGIAEQLSGATALTLPGQIIGTANYMAPERAADRPADARSDIYAVGVVLFELLTGRLPFVGDSPLAVLVQHVNDPPPAPGDLVPGLPAAVERALLQALAKHPDDRQQSAAELAAELRRLEAGLGQTGPTAVMPAARSAASAGTGPWPSRPDPADAGPPPGPRLQPAPPERAFSRRPSPLVSLLAAALLAAVALWLALGRGGAQADVDRVDVRLEDTAWEGGARNAAGYGGRSAVWIYGEGSGQSSMRAPFAVLDAPTGQSELVVEGMDSEGPQKTTIEIAINGQTIYSGPNPLPDDDYNLANLDTGTWGSYSFAFDSAILRPGPNEVTIANRSPGQYSQPPFFMLDYAVVRQR